KKGNWTHKTNLWQDYLVWLLSPWRLAPSCASISVFEKGALLAGAFPGTGRYVPTVARAPRTYVTFGYFGREELLAIFRKLLLSSEESRGISSKGDGERSQEVLDIAGPLSG
ncbi:MAG: hypothetical protein ACE5IJ_09495, partial [Thermoplasmata archaeon]